jgi:hypothetical protein
VNKSKPSENLYRLILHFPPFYAMMDMISVFNLFQKGKYFRGVKMKRISMFLAVFMALIMILPVVAQAEIGSEENPIKVLFVPSVEANTIVTGGEIMAKAYTTLRVFL